MCEVYVWYDLIDGRICVKNEFCVCLKVINVGNRICRWRGKTKENPEPFLNFLRHMCISSIAHEWRYVYILTIHSINSFVMCLCRKWMRYNPNLIRQHEPPHNLLSGLGSSILAPKRLCTKEWGWGMKAWAIEISVNMMLIRILEDRREKMEKKDKWNPWKEKIPQKEKKSTHHNMDEVRS